MTATLKTTNIQEPSSATVNLALDTSGNVTVGSSLTAATNITATAGTVSMASSFLRNKIINGAMVIDQRNAGASVTPAVGATYTVDRWALAAAQSSKVSIQQNAGSVTPPNGYKNYIGITSLSSYSVLAGDYFTIQQSIEGFNISDLGFGASGAQTVTVSFWVRSSITGTFGGSLNNSGSSRSYPFTYTITAANTWEQKSITIVGDATGTWLSNNGVGLVLNLSLGMGSTYSGTAGSWAGSAYFSATGAQSIVGTNGATFYITGVQLEVGSVATPFERRLYGQELALCQRYYETNFPSGTAPGATDSTNPTYLFMDGLATQTHTGQQYVQYKVVKRASATVTIYSISNGASGVLYDYNGTTNRTAATQFAGPWSFIGYSTSLGNANNINMAFNWTAAAEL